MGDRTPVLGDIGGYEIRTQGHLDERWTDWFEGVVLVREPDSTTRFRCPGLDQAALHGLLAKLRDLGLPLISVTPTSLPDDGSPRSTEP